MIYDFLKYALRTFKRLDWGLVFLSAALLFTSCLFIYGAGNQIGGKFEYYWLKQLAWVIIGSACAGTIVLIDYRKLGRFSWLFYLCGISLLVFVLLAGKEINGAKSWIHLPGATLQPSETAKPATIFFLAWVASRSLISPKNWVGIIILGTITLVPLLLIAAQPDFGTALIFAPIFLSVLFVGGISWKKIIGWSILGLSITYPFYMFILSDYQQDRIDIFLKPPDTVNDLTWNSFQSLYAVGSGGFWGKGFMKGTQHVLGFLPQTVAPTDFIFSVFGEEAGFIGGGAMLCAFFGILFCCLKNAGAAADRFGVYICTGVASMFFIHVFINIGMTIQAAPIIGIPLPFVSYGGSSILSAMICLGLVQSVYVRRHEQESA